MRRSVDKLIGSGLEGMGQSLPASPSLDSRLPHCMDICLDPLTLWLIFTEAMTKLVVSRVLSQFHRDSLGERHRCGRSSREIRISSPQWGSD